VQDGMQQVPTGLDRLFDRTWLSAMYLDAHTSVTGIGSVVGAPDAVVAAALRNAGITLRDTGQARFPQLRDRDYVVDALAARRLTLRDMAREVGCSEQSAGDAARHPEMAMALAAAGWTPGRPPGAPIGGHVPKVPLPTDDEIVSCVRTLTSSNEEWATRGDIRVATGVGDGQYHSFAKRLESLVADGRLAAATVPRPGGGRPPRCYQVARQAQV
jgi:hypothetical protein